MYRNKLLQNYPRYSYSMPESPAHKNEIRIYRSKKHVTWWHYILHGAAAVVIVQHQTACGARRTGGHLVRTHVLWRRRWPCSDIGNPWQRGRGLGVKAYSFVIVTSLALGAAVKLILTANSLQKHGSHSVNHCPGRTRLFMCAVNHWQHTAYTNTRVFLSIIALTAYSPHKHTCPELSLHSAFAPIP